VNERSRGLVEALETVLKQYADRPVRPESALPAPQQVLVQAVLAMAEEWLRLGELTAERHQFLRTAFAELETFVPDEDAAVVLRVQQAAATGAPASAEDRARSQTVLDLVRVSRARVVAELIEMAEDNPTVRRLLATPAQPAFRVPSRPAHFDFAQPATLAVTDASAAAPPSSAVMRSSSTAQVGFMMRV